MAVTFDYAMESLRIFDVDIAILSQHLYNTGIVDDFVLDYETKNPTATLYIHTPWESRLMVTDIRDDERYSDELSRGKIVLVTEYEAGTDDEDGVVEQEFCLWIELKKDISLWASYN